MGGSNDCNVISGRVFMVGTNFSLVTLDFSSFRLVGVALLQSSYESSLDFILIEQMIYFHIKDVVCSEFLSCPLQTRTIWRFLLI